MTDLTSLLELKGVVAALRFYDDGTLAEAEGQLGQIDVNLAAELCYANGRIMHQNSDIFMTLSGASGWPPQGWMMIGDALSVCAIAGVACFVRNGDVSFNDVFQALTEISKK
jgi:roadblock/LC7 domain-containing protein